MNKNCLKEGSKFKLNHKNKTDGLLLLLKIKDVKDEILKQLNLPEAFGGEK